MIKIKPCPFCQSKAKSTAFSAFSMAIICTNKQCSALMIQSIPDKTPKDILDKMKDKSLARFKRAIDQWTVSQIVERWNKRK